MEKFWIYAVVYLVGLISGIILWEKIGVGDEYRAYIRKIRQRGRDNATSTVVFKPIQGTKEDKQGKLSLRDKIKRNKEERQARKAARKG